MTLREFYNSVAWKNVRSYVRKRDGGLCVDCLKRGLYTPSSEVHHIIELTESNVDDPSIALDESNLISLCHNCHMKRHSKGKRYTVDPITGKVK